MSTPPQPDTATADDGPRSMAATVPVADLLARETTLSFADLTPADQGDHPDAVSSEARCLDPDPRPLKDVIATLPQASSGELWATNEFVGVDGTVDTEAICDIHGLDVDALEDAAGCSFGDLATRASSDPLVRIRDHQDIVDERRKRCVPSATTSSSAGRSPRTDIRSSTHRRRISPSSVRSSSAVRLRRSAGRATGIGVASSRCSLSVRASSTPSPGVGTQSSMTTPTA